MTTIPQAMARLRISDDSRLRRQLARRLESRWRDVLLSPEKRRQLEEALGRAVNETRRAHWNQQVRTWQVASILLTEDEKLFARFILLRQRRFQPLPALRDLANAIELRPTAVRQGIRNLAWIGFLELADSRKPDSYTLSQDHARFLEGLGFTFHTVELRRNERFGVP